MAKPRKPSVEEKRALRVLFTDSLIQSTHGIIQENVRTYLRELLVVLGRPDLAEHVGDYEKLLAD